jgi:hypothetical protein
VLDKIFGDGGAKDAKKASKKAAQEAEARKRAISQGTTQVKSAFAQAFTPAWYEQLRAAHDQYYFPQVETQYKDAQKQTLFGLARQGLMDSSVRGDWFGKLQSRYGQAKQDVVRRGEALVGQRKGEVGRAMETSLMQLNAAEDPLAAASIGAQNAKLNAYTPDYQPLGQVFTDLTNAIATQRQMEDQGNNRYATPSWLSWASSSGKTRN